MREHFRHWLVRGALVLTAAMFSVAGVVYAEAGATAAQHFDIPAQSTSAALNEFSKQSGLRLLFSYDAVEGMQAGAISGTFSPEEVLRKLLAGTGLHYEVTADSVVLIRASGSSSEKVTRSGSSASGEMEAADVRLAQAATNPSPSEGEGQGEDGKQRTVEKGQDEEDPERAGIPEILVTGSKLRSLNIDIKRTEDDIQPYVVFDREVVARSGATNLEELFRNELPMSVNSLAASQDISLGNKSSINLRGLGSDETLILIDGRRAAQFNGFSPQQSDINNIPLSAIERIEVLPTTASGIYGGGATGGVINVVLRRDYSGVEAKVTYGNTFASDAADRRIDLSAGFNLEQGRTNILFAGSYADTDPLLIHERHLAQRGRQHILINNPGFFLEAIPPLGSTPNIRSAVVTNGVRQPLTLDNGTPLNSTITYVPHGYAGAVLDGGAALVTNAGRFNLELANTAQFDGGRAGLLNSPEAKSLIFTLRREMTTRVQGFLDIQASDASTSFAHNSSTRISRIIPADAPSNPFQQAIEVAVPAIGLDDSYTSKYENRRAVAGLIVELGQSWQAVIDFTWDRSRSSFVQPGGMSLATVNAINNGTLDILRDLNQYPAAFEKQPVPNSASLPSDTVLRNTTLRLAGPLDWFSLPGGALHFQR